MLRRALAAGAVAAGRLAAPAEQRVVLRGSSFPLRCLGSSACRLEPEVTQDAGLGGKAPLGASAGAAATAFRPATAGPEWLGGDKQDAGEAVPWDQLSPEQFSTVADWYLSRLWMRFEKGLRLALGEEFAYEIQPEPGAMRVLLPYDGQLVVRKDADSRTLVVESNLFEPFEDKDRMEFRPRAEDQWESEDGDTLPDFAAEAMSRYLKAQVRL